MKITALLLKNSRVQVFVDDRYAFSCTQNFIVENTLHSNLEITPEEFDDLKKKAQYSIVEYKLLEYANRGKYSEIELKRKVSNYCYKKFDFMPDEEFFKKGFEKLKRLHLFDSELIAKRLGEKYVSRSKGKGYISSKLISKGFKKNDVNVAVENVNENELLENLKIILQKKLKSLKSKESDKFKLRQKLSQFAANKGYGYKEIREVLDKML